MPSPGPLLRRLLLGLVALVALLGLAALALPLVIDANAFRPQIEQVVAGRFKRVLSINGDLRLSVFPRLAVVLPKTTLSERESDRTFARLEQARIGVALWPLLAGRFEAGAIEITGLDATIERRADGSTSIDDLIGRGTLQRADPPGKRDDGSAPAHAVAGLELVDARLTLIDGGRRVLTVFSLDLSTGALAPKASSPVKLAMAFSAPQARAQGALALDGTLEVNSAAGSLGVQSLRLGARGDIASAGLEVNMSGSRLELEPAFRGEKLKLTFLSADASDPYLTIDIDEVVGTIERLRAGSARIITDQRRGQRTIAARLVRTAEAS